MEQRDYHPGDVILREGEPSDFVYRVITGEVEIFSELEGQTVVLGTVNSGDFLGEMGIIDGQPRSASARAKDEVTVTRLERWEFFRLMSGESSSAFRLIARLGDRLRAVSRKLAEVTVSKNAYTYTLEDPTSDSDSPTLPGLVVAHSESAQPRIRILPASREASSALPQDGLPVSRLPFSVGRLTQSNEPGPNVPIDLRLPDTPPFRLSRQHFSVSRHLNGYVVLDLGSTLGTQVNGESLGHHFGKDYKYLQKGENMVQAGGVGSPFAFKVIVEDA